MRYYISSRSSDGTTIYLAAWRTPSGDIECTWEESIHYAKKFDTRKEAFDFIQKHLPDTDWRSPARVREANE